MTIAPALSIIEAANDWALFGRWVSGATWRAWHVLLKALFGLGLDDLEREIFRRCTGRKEPRQGGYREAWLVVGRRGGKSLILALIAVFLACFRDWTPYLTEGERGTIFVVAADRKQARVIFRYCLAMLLNVPLLAGLIERETAETIELKNGVTIEIGTGSYRTLRGPTLIALIGDEIAYWRAEDSANPDEEIIAAARPAMATIPNALLLAGSSPHARRGVLWKTYRRHFGIDDSPVLVWQADTKTMNPTVPDEVIAEAYEADPARASAEFGALFRVDVETYIANEVVAAATIPDRHELPPMKGVRYVAFTDPSGGSADSFTLAIAHRDKDGRGILDAVRERRPPFSPDDVTQDFAALLKAYGLRRVTGDRYAGEWPRERFRVHGITYELADRPKSDLYRDFLPLANSGRVELLDHPRLSSQLIALERRTSRGGRDSIDHPPGAHDDVSNAVAGALVAVAGATHFSRIEELVV